MAMSNRITFQFDDKLKHQREAVDSVVDLFKGINNRKTDSAIYRNLNRSQKVIEDEPVRNPQIVVGTGLKNNLRDVQLRNLLFVDSEIMGNNYSIEMETGTGKTYVYIRTMLELYTIYGFTKFMIVVPSIAIRKGVEKSIDMLREHFKALYDGLDIKNHSFVYDSSNPKKISSSFVETRDLSIVIMNIQAFNKEANKLRQSDEYGQILWEDIKYIKPIIIIDEPQKIEGTAKKKTASLEAIEKLNPLFTLRYSATHKRLFNQVYKLNSYDAYQNNLVKKIEVKTVQGTIPKNFPYVRYVEFTKDLYAKVEIFRIEQGGVIRTKQISVRSGADLYELSGYLSQYKNIIIQEDPHQLKKLKIGTGDNIIELAIGENNSGLNESETIRIQIRLAIKSHLEKQYKILKKGYDIKVLTLFFIDAVNKIRDVTSPDGRGEYLRIFDDEYSKIIKDTKWKMLFVKYPKLFKEYHDIHKVREGYFAVDKHKNAVEVDGWEAILDEQKLKAKSQEDVDRGIELILEKKDELISFDAPLAFIFSHSALREGWDNPNVFTICTLKKGSSEIAKKQEIGRGLRLPVDIHGNRCMDSEVNELTVIANDYYEQFADSLQKDFNEQAGFNKDEVTADVIYKTLENAGIPKTKITAELVDIFKKELLEQKLISNKNILTKEVKTLAIVDFIFKDKTLQEHSQMIKAKFIEYMVAKGTKKIYIKNGDEEPVENGQNSFMSEEEFAKLLKELSNRMTKRTMYQVKIDSDSFIATCINELNEILRYKRLRSQFEIGTGKAEFTEQKKIKLKDPTNQIIYEEIDGTFEDKSDFEIINYIMYHTMLPRLAIFKIISGIEKKILLKNQDIMDNITQKIKSILKDFKAQGITDYKIIDGYLFDDKAIFEAESIDRGMLDATSLIYHTKEGNRRALQKYYKLDSKGERAFVAQLDTDENVLLYTKIKKGGFVIDTPYGDYSPDWAVIYKGENHIAKLYFIVETKSDKEWKDLSDVEQLKIKCGELHFKAVAKDISFKWAKNYEDFKRKVFK